MSRKLKGRNPCRRESTPRGIQPNSACEVRLFTENRTDYSSDSVAYALIAEKLGCSRFTLREWCTQTERDTGERPDRSGADKVKIKELERENKELRTANEILKKASAYFAQTELDRPFRR